MVFHRYGTVISLIMAGLFWVPAAHSQQHQHATTPQVVAAADAAAASHKEKSSEGDKSAPS